MENIQFTISAKETLREVIEEYFSKYFAITETIFEDCWIKLSAFLGTVKPNLFVCIEYPYVDKIYRDEYYHYYSSKLISYPRNCIRLSFFDQPILESDFRKQERFGFLQGHFKGFMVLRPTAPSIIGRSILSPNMFDNPPIYCCTCDTSALINGVKMHIAGYPHTSQDGEMMVCAETTIWSIMEYFSKKYSEYIPVLPHQIHQLLSERSSERQIPSQGLTALDISYAIKKLGFGVKYYTRKSYGHEFFFVLKCYIESGLPVITSITKAEELGHVVNLIGRTDFVPEQVDQLVEKSPFGDGRFLENGLKFYDYYDLPFEYVMIDDNHPPYRVVPLSQPAKHYGAASEWRRSEINHIVVPLYRRIYMEADDAKNLAIATVNTLPQGQGDHIVMRVFLTSSRSFKYFVAVNGSMSESLKELIISSAHPRFVWIAELSTKDLLKQKKACGMIMMDATQPQNRNDALLGYFYNNLYFRTSNETIVEITLESTEFEMYSTNLKML